MNCEKAKELIGRYFNEEEPVIPLDLQQHLAHCEDCNAIYEAGEKLKTITSLIRKSEPSISNATGLTEDIMNAVEAGEEKVAGPGRLRKLAFHPLLKWVISSAAVVLFAVFCIEQYIVLDKINHLEVQSKNVSSATIRSNLSWEYRSLQHFNVLKARHENILRKLEFVGERLSLSEITGMYNFRERMQAGIYIRNMSVKGKHLLYYEQMIIDQNTTVNTNQH